MKNKKRKEIFSFTADPDLVENAVAVATTMDQSFSKFVSIAIEKYLDQLDLNLTK